MVTGTRAEYGLLRWVMEEIRESSSLELQLIATGMHLSPEFGLTYRDIEADGFRIDRKVEMLLSADTPSAIIKSMGLAMIGFADAYAQLRPDLLLVLGDRYEILAAATAAMQGAPRRAGPSARRWAGRRARRAHQLKEGARASVDRQVARGLPTWKWPHVAMRATNVPSVSGSNAALNASP